MPVSAIVTSDPVLFLIVRLFRLISYILKRTATTILLNDDWPAPDVLTILTPTSVPATPTATFNPDTKLETTPLSAKVCSDAGAVLGADITSTL
jgi:hypothetical protein